MTKKITKKFTVVRTVVAYGLLCIFLSTTITPIFGAPLNGTQGSRIHANFMSQDPDPVGGGQYVDIRWQIVNTLSTTTENLKFHLETEYPLLFDAGDTPDKDLGASAGTNDDKTFYVLHYKLKVADTATKGTYNVTLRWSTGDGWVEKTYPIYVDPKKSDFVVGTLVTSPEKLMADTDETKLSVNIDNIGKGKAENVKVRLLLPLGFKPTYSYSNEDSLGIIEKGGSKTANFYVDIDENIIEGEYNANLEITYKNENDENSEYKTKNLSLIIPIKPAPRLVIESITTNPEKLMVGNKADILIKVKNGGNEKAKSVSLRVFKDSSQPFEFSEKSDFIGKLEPGETGDATIKITINKEADIKKYLLDIELRGIDDKENVVIFRRSAPLNIYPGEKGIPLGTIGIFGGLLAIMVGITIFYLKNNRKK